MSQDTFNTDPQDSSESSPTDALEALGAGPEMQFIATEPKKTINKTSLVLFIIVAIGGAGLYLMHLRTGPQAASASNTEAANRTINQFLSGGSSNIKVMETMLRNTEKVVAQFNAYPSVKQIPLTELQTNPFRVTTGAAEDQDDPIAKRKLAEQRQTVLKTYQTLQLQSIMYGDKSRSCLINNTLYREGQAVSGFTIEKITKDNVSIKQDAWRFDLKMAK